MKQRLDQAMVVRGLVTSRSQAESYIKLGQVKVNSEIAKKPHRQVDDHDRIEVTVEEQYVSRAAFKLASVAELFKLDFSDKVVLDIVRLPVVLRSMRCDHGAKKSTLSMSAPSSCIQACGVMSGLIYVNKLTYETLKIYSQNQILSWLMCRLFHYVR
jgi:ribosomal 50S subunit-recycling heat shock protein